MSTDKQRGGKRGGSLDLEAIQEQLTEYEEQHDKATNEDE